jgi:hypothetical protein
MVYKRLIRPLLRSGTLSSSSAERGDCKMDEGQKKKILYPLSSEAEERVDKRSGVGVS